MSATKNLTRDRKRLWAVLGGITVGGSIAKIMYFTYVENLFADQIKENNMKAVNRLHEARSYGQWAKTDREQQLPPLNEEQKEQLRRYLSLRAKKRPDLYPSDNY